MAFFLEKTNPNLSLSKVHKFLRYDTDGGVLVAVVNSYAEFESLTLGNGGLLNFQERYVLPPEQAADPEAWLISTVGPFAGATKLADDTPLEMARSLIWAQFKRIRDQKEFGTFTYQTFSMDASPLSVQRIMLAAQAAQTNIANGTPGVVNWTTSDNKVVTLSSQEIVEMLQALQAHVTGVHETASVLRDQLFDPATDTLEKIYAIQWPL